MPQAAFLRPQYCRYEDSDRGSSFNAASGISPPAIASLGSLAGGGLVGAVGKTSGFLTIFAFCNITKRHNSIV